MRTIDVTIREYVNFKAIFKYFFELFVLNGIIYVMADDILLKQFGY